MKNNLFDLLLSFFEESLAQLKKSRIKKELPPEEEDPSNLFLEQHSLFIREAKATAIRVFTFEEQQKLTKASYQFLKRLILFDIIPQEILELILTQLLLSESRFVDLQETKWTIRNILIDNLTSAQLAFLDLVLYQKEDNLPLH